MTNEWLADFYKHNEDGIGVMWAADGKLHIEKLVPKSFKELKKFYRTYADKKQCAVHFRMRTHGDIDLDNCHPYQVFGEDDGYPLWLMHNGVLHTGNAADSSKSDTWHYINDIIKPALASRPEDFMSDWFQTLVEEHIGGSNKFVIMDAHGNMRTFNYDSGVEWGDVWMSNTYAWDAGKAGLLKPVAYGSFNKYGYGGYYSGSSWDDEDYLKPERKSTNSVRAISSPKYQDDSAEMVFASVFMDTLSDNRYYQSYSTLSHEELADYYLSDPEGAEDMLLALESYRLDDLDILEYFDTINYNKSFGVDTEDRIGAYAG
jgi:hypothetical protein